MKVLEINSIQKEDGYIYYIHHYKAIAKVEVLSKDLDGKFYLNDGVNKNDRYAITSKDHIGDPLFIIGYVKETEILR